MLEKKIENKKPSTLVGGPTKSFGQNFNQDTFFYPVDIFREKITPPFRVIFPRWVLLSLTRVWIHLILILEHSEKIAAIPHRPPI